MTVLFGFDCPTELYGAACGVLVFALLQLAWRSTWVRNPGIIQPGTIVLIERTRTAQRTRAWVRLFESRDNSTETEDLELDDNGTLLTPAAAATQAEAGERERIISAMDATTAALASNQAAVDDTGTDTESFRIMDDTMNLAISAMTSQAQAVADGRVDVDSASEALRQLNNSLDATRAAIASHQAAVGDTANVAQTLRNLRNTTTAAHDAAVAVAAAVAAAATATVAVEDTDSASVEPVAEVLEVTASSASTATANDSNGSGADGDGLRLRHRRHYNTAALDDQTDNAAVVDAQNCTNENSENSGNVAGGSVHIIPAATASTTETAFTIKLKYLNDDMKIASGTPSEPVGEFTKRNFAAELADNKTVRLIFNGQVLRPETKTLRACGMFADCVVHCLVRNTPPAPAAAVGAAANSAAVAAAAGGGNNGATNRSIAAIGGLVGAHNVARPFDTFAERTETHVKLMYALLTCGGMLAAAGWYMRVQYSSLFTVSSTFGLGLLSGMLFVMWWVILRIERDIEQTPGAPAMNANNGVGMGGDGMVDGRVADAGNVFQ